MFLLAIFPALALATYTVPRPSGTYGVSLEDKQLVDYSLPDPYLPLPYRRIEVSVIAPTDTCNPVTQPYMPSAQSAQFWEQYLTNQTTIPFNGTVSQTVLNLCKPRLDFAETPLILFAPGAGYPRQLYSILLTTLVAKSGYTVVSFEQPGYAEFETFPDGSTEDVSFILDTFNITSIHRWAAIFGHSEGGAVTAASVVAEPHRLLGGINLDGAFYGPPLNNSIYAPFAILSSTIHNQSTSPSWPIVWQNLKGDKWQIQLNDSQHASYGDFPYLADLWGIRQGTKATIIDGLVGGIPGTEAIEVVSDTVKTFFDFVFGKGTVNGVVDVAEELGVWKVQNVSIA